jgi:hypothetical protein
MNWQVERLVAEWVKHERIIIGVDYDDTLMPWSLDGPVHTARLARTRVLLRACVELGARIVIHTASNPERYAEIRHTCRAERIAIEAINENLPGLKYGTTTKPYANIYLDDRAGIDQALDVLSAAYEIMRREKGRNTY